MPETFPKWVSDSKATPMGVFEGEDLIALANLERVDGTSIAWVQGLRVKDGYRQKGYGTSVTNAIVDISRTMGIRTLWYATSSKNTSSQHVAERTGFKVVDNTGYFRLYKPYPPHAKPSPSIVPLQVNPSRLFEILQENPDLVQSTTFPLAWEFDFRSIEGLTRLLQNATIRVIIDESGRAQGVYCMITRQRKDELTAAYTVFTTDRSIFVDIISRTIDEAETLGANRAVYFLGPRATEWALTLGFVDEEFNGRQFLLYELNPAANA
ncbi:MAG: GNAT family N-acetyltransferase [Candidatus Thorarchaeota archaeon]|nr:GNAT family N-acetyltransferase [Candidatus Thorarchaeota archaeon]